MNQAKSLDDLAQIRAIMERSKKFLSLSPWAAIMAGVYALLGAGWAYWEIYYSPVVIYDQLETGRIVPSVYGLLLMAAGVFVLAAGTGLWVSYRKAQRAGQSLWSKAAIRLAVNFALPLLAGGIWEAMITTGVGLTVAIPLVILLHLLEGAVERRVQSMQRCSALLLERRSSAVAEKDRTRPMRQWEEVTNGL